MFDRIHILPTSVVPRAASPGAPQPSGLSARPPVRQPQVVRQPPFVPAAPAPDDQTDDSANEDPGETTVPLPRRGRVVRPGIQGPLGPEPQVTTADEEDDEEAATTPVATPTPGNPFGVPFGSSSKPGVVTPPPQQQRPQGER